MRLTFDFPTVNLGTFWERSPDTVLHMWWWHNVKLTSDLKPWQKKQVLIHYLASKWSPDVWNTWSLIHFSLLDRVWGRPLVQILMWATFFVFHTPPHQIWKPNMSWRFSSWAILAVNACKHSSCKCKPSKFQIRHWKLSVLMAYILKLSTKHQENHNYILKF